VSLNEKAVGEGDVEDWTLRGGFFPIYEGPLASRVRGGGGGPPLETKGHHTTTGRGNARIHQFLARRGGKGNQPYNPERRGGGSPTFERRLPPLSPGRGRWKGNVYPKKRKRDASPLSLREVRQ